MIYQRYWNRYFPTIETERYNYNYVSRLLFMILVTKLTLTSNNVALWRGQHCIRFRNDCLASSIVMPKSVKVKHFIIFIVYLKNYRVETDDALQRALSGG